MLFSRLMKQGSNQIEKNERTGGGISTSNGTKKTLVNLYKTCRRNPNLVRTTRKGQERTRKYDRKVKKMTRSQTNQDRNFPKQT